MIFQQYYLLWDKELPNDGGFVRNALWEVLFEFSDVNDGFVESLDKAFEFFCDNVREAFGCEFARVQLASMLLLE